MAVKWMQDDLANEKRFKPGRLKQRCSAIEKSVYSNHN